MCGTANAQPEESEALAALVSLVEELCERIDHDAEDIGGSRARPVGELISHLGPTADKARRALAAKRVPVSLAKLADALIDDGPSMWGDLDGFERQDLLVECGLMEGVTVEERCDEMHCECEAGDTCYRLTDFGRQCIRIAEAGAETAQRGEEGG